MRASFAGLAFRFFGDVLGDGKLSSLYESLPSPMPRKRDFLGEVSTFCGEYWSFHSLTSSTLQNASRLGLLLCGGVGMRAGRALVGDTRRDLEGLVGGGGVDGRSVGGALRGERALGGEKWRIA